MNLALFAGYWALDVALQRPLSEFYEGKRVGHHMMEIQRAQLRHAETHGGFWKRDLAGLHVASDPASLDAKVAAADAAPASGTAALPLDGFWFRALPFEDEATPDPRRFAVLAVPYGPAQGTFLYAFKLGETLWSKRPVPGGVHVFPADPAAEGWQRVP